MNNIEVFEFCALKLKILLKNSLLKSEKTSYKFYYFYISMD